MSDEAVQTVLVQIKHRFTGATIFECQAGANLSQGKQLGFAVVSALNAGKNLSYADMTRADMTRAVMTRAVMIGADMTRAVMTDAVMIGADMTRAVMTDAVMTRAVMIGADMTDADMTRAVMTDAVMTRADLSKIKSAFFAVLIEAKDEVAQLRAALVGGQVNGSAYEGRCACLKGSIANFKGVQYNQMSGALTPNSSSTEERWFMGIATGDTPETNQISKITVNWIDEFTALIGAAK